MSNKKLIYIEDVEDLRELYSDIISTIISFEVVEFADSPSGIDYLKKHESEIACIISDINLNETSGFDFYEFVKEQKLQIPIVFISGEDKDSFELMGEFLKYNSNNSFIQKPASKAVLEEKLKFLSSLDNSGGSEHAVVTFRMMKRLKRTPVDLYIKASETKYIKVFHADTELAEGDYEKFIRKELSCFYIKSADKEKFSDLAFALVSKMISAIPKNLSKDSVGKITSVAEVVHGNFKAIGISDSTLSMAKHAVDATVESIEKTESLKDLLDGIMKGGDFLSEHTIAVILICHMILEKMEWASRQTREKITLAGYMHDVSLPSGEGWVQDLDGYTRLDTKDLKSKQPKFFNHPIESSEIVAKFKEIPPDVDVIVAQHHEMPDGSGFPIGLNGMRTAPLACVFNTAHFFICGLYEKEFSDEAKKETLKRMEELFTVGNYKKAYKALVEVLDE